MSPESAKSQGKLPIRKTPIEDTHKPLGTTDAASESDLSDAPASGDDEPVEDKPAASPEPKMEKSSTTPKAKGQVNKVKTTTLIPGDFTNGKAGGFIKSPAKRRQIVSLQTIRPGVTQLIRLQMKWSAENENKLLLLGLGRETFTQPELQKIADSFPEKVSLASNSSSCSRRLTIL